MPMKKADRQLLMLIGIAVCVAILWWAVSRGSSSEQPGPNATTSSVIDSPTATVSEPKPPASPGTEQGPSDAPTPASGLPTIAESALPRQARDTLALIRAGGPYPYDEDDGIFQNRERILPRQSRGYYREYTVETPGSDDRGARRIIGGVDGDRYYTDDHYDSFRQIIEGD